MTEYQSLSRMASEVRAGKKVFRKFFDATEEGILIKDKPDEDTQPEDQIAFMECKGENFVEKHHRDVLTYVEKYVRKRVVKNLDVSNQLIERQFKKASLASIIGFQQCLGSSVIDYKKSLKESE